MNSNSNSNAIFTLCSHLCVGDNVAPLDDIMLTKVPGQSCSVVKESNNVNNNCKVFFMIIILS